MAGTWAGVLPYALLLSALVAIIRTQPLREAKPGLAILQRLGIVLLTAPLATLVLIGLTSLPRLSSGATPLAVPSDLLAGKALIHFLLYLAVPTVGLVLVVGPRRVPGALPRFLFGDSPDRRSISRGLARAAGVCGLLVAGVLLGWPALADQAGLFSAEGPRVFFSQTTPAIALALAGVAAVAEELLFRGVLLKQLDRWLSRHPAVALQALLFGLIHAGYGSLLHVAAATAFGLLLGYLALRDGLMPAMAVHFVVNVAVLAAWSEQGTLVATALVLVLSLGLLSWATHQPEAPAETSASAAAA